jgi:hypothetical protein
MWKEIYNKAFPNLQSINNAREDGELQSHGIDRILVLNSGKVICVDEKVRRKNYPDILLEYIANDQTKTKGWIEKSLLCDFIAYAFINTGFCYLLPVVPLQKAWTVNKDKWFKEFKIVVAENKNYKTLSLPIPIPILFTAIGNSLRIRFTPVLES